MKRRIAASYAAASTRRCVDTRCSGSLRVVIGAPRRADRGGLAGDPVLLAEPAPEIDQVAALAAEREQLLEARRVPGHRRLARRAREHPHDAAPGAPSP